MCCAWLWFGNNVFFIDQITFLFYMLPEVNNNFRVARLEIWIFMVISYYVVPKLLFDLDNFNEKGYNPHHFVSCNFLSNGLRYTFKFFYLYFLKKPILFLIFPILYVWFIFFWFQYCFSCYWLWLIGAHLSIFVTSAAIHQKDIVVLHESLMLSWLKLETKMRKIKFPKT